MGQDITVRARAGASPSVRFFDCNRSLTGMGIERFASPDAVVGDRPADVLAGRLFELGASRVAIYSSVVTVEAPADRWVELEPQVVATIQRLFGYYGEDAGWAPDASRTEGDGDTTDATPEAAEAS